jgi:uncharacterized protein YcbK (DUF882 family)
MTLRNNVPASFSPLRRQLLKGLLAAPLTLPGAGALAAEAQAAGDYRLAFRHTQTDEHLQLAYRNAEGYIVPALERINWLMRDFRTGQVQPMDPRLLDLLHALENCCGSGTFEIVSAYRSPATNDMLRKTGGGGVARRSLHMDGQAIDIRLGGTSCAQLRDAAIALGRGGVGYYPAENFVHVDTGPVRHWGPRRA